MNPLLHTLLSPEPIRRKIVRGLLAQAPVLQRWLSLDERIAHALVPRPHYAYCMLGGARLAHRLGFGRMSMVEFGVAGGAGLVAAEGLAPEIESETGVGLDLIGFDMGSGMPEPKDYRDMSYHWKPGYFRMDEAALRARLKRAQVVLGPVAQTVPVNVTLDRFEKSPLGAVVFDLDFHSSTMDAFKVFDAPAASRLPRVLCYMDDVVGELERHSDFTGVRGAVADFNRQHETMKLSPLYLGAMPDLRLRVPQLMMLHDFVHPAYNTFVGSEHEQGQLPL